MTKGSPPRFATYDAFFAFYLQEHSCHGNRVLHVAGTSLGVAVGVGALLTGRAKLVLLAPVISYAFAWAGHFFVEGNVPATLGHPVWSFISDFRMLHLLATGRFDAAAHSSTRPPPPDDSSV